MKNLESEKNNDFIAGFFSGIRFIFVLSTKKVTIRAMQRTFCILMLMHSGFVRFLAFGELQKLQSAGRQEKLT